MRLLIALVAALMLTAGVARAADAPGAPPPSGWLEQSLAQIEAEAAGDFAAVPDIPEALSREWRSFDKAGSPLGTLLDVAWVAAAAILALIAELAGVRLLSHWVRHRVAAREDGPSLVDLLRLLGCDIAGLAVFVTVFTLARRHVLGELGVTATLSIFATNVLIRWRIAALVIGAVLRPGVPGARLVELTDTQARGLDRFLSLAVLAIILLVAFGRYGLMDEDSGAAHVIGLINGLLVCGLYVVIVFRSRTATELLIRGRRSIGAIAAVRGGLARAWLPTALILVAGLLLFFVAGLSLGWLSYYHAVTSTLGIWFVVLVLDRLTERAWHDTDPAGAGPLSLERLQARTAHRILRAIGGAVAALALAWIWIDAVEPTPAGSELAMRSATATVGTLFVAFVVWELIRLAIDRHLQDMGGGPSLPGADDDTATPASRLQTILPMMRAVFAVVIGVLATLIVLSRLGVDTAPLIAGAGVFGLALSFGSQSLVRDIISGLFYMWDDAFRVGEYIDTGRLKGTVESIGVRSVRLRHQNGPLHTIPYGQLGAVTNLSRDFSTIKFNLRFEPGTDIELVRKTAKQLGVTMQDDPEMAAEIILPLKLQGLAEIADNAVVLRFKFTARPVKPSWVQREYLKRLVQVFGEKDIHFASGAMVLQTLPPPDAPPADAPPAPRSRRAAKSAPPIETEAVAGGG